MVAVDLKKSVSYVAQHFDMEAMATAMMRQWDEVPAALAYHISTAEDVVQESIRFESIGIAASYEAVSTMAVADYGLGLGRSSYEIFQGQIDFKGKKSDPNWQPPREKIHRPNGTVEIFDGTQSTLGATCVEKNNSHKMDRGKMLNFDSDGSRRMSDDNEKRMGGFGQGTKIELALSVANKQDRINILTLVKDRGDLKSWEVDKVDKTIERLRVSLENEGENETFSTVQAQGHDGRYYRIYCYREPYTTNEVDLWKLRYIVCDLDEDKIPKDEIGQTTVAVHNPDPELCRVLDSAKENILLMDPEYDSPSSLVREGNDTRPTVKIETTHFEQSEERKDSIFSDKNDLPGKFDVERLRRQRNEGGRVYYRQLHLLPEENPEMNLIFDYNLKNLDADAVAKIKRTSNSTYVTGPIGEIVAQTTGRMNNVEDWTIIFEKLDELTKAGVEINKKNWPELCPIKKSGYSEIKQNEITESKVIHEAFMFVWPNSNGRYCLSDEQAKIHRLLHNETMTMPVIPPGEMDVFLYFEGGIKSVNREISEEMSKKFNIKESNRITELSSREHLDKVRESETYKKAMESGPITMEKFVELAFIENDVFGVVDGGETYYIDAPYGKHVIDIVFSDGEAFDRIFWSLEYEHILSGNENGLSLLLAAIDSGLDLSVLSKNYRREDSRNFLKTKNGDVLMVNGESQRDEKHDVGCRLRFGGTFDEVTKIMAALDITIGKERPNLILSRPGNEFEQAVETIQAVIGALKPGEKVTTGTLESVKEMLQEASNQKKEAENTLLQFKGEVKRRIGQTGGDINGAQMTGKFNEGGSLTNINKEWVAIGRSSRVNSYRSRPRIVEGENEGGRKKESELVFKNPDYKIMMYDGREIGDFHPLEAYDTLSYGKGEILQESRYNDIVLDEEGNGPWRSYDSNKGPSYIDRREMEDGYNYDGIIETNLSILPISGETVLPVDALKYDIVYIQLPITEGSMSDPPYLMKDKINDQYQVVFSQPGKQSDMIKTLPPGTRIYIREKTYDTDLTDEQRLALYYPKYSESLNKSIIKKNKLDAEAEKVLQIIKDRTPTLTTREKMQAIDNFWYKRRLYDNEGIKVDTIEELIKSGVGVCAESEIGMSEMARFVGVKCRSRIGYPDGRQTGQMTPPLHAEIEFLNDAGMWERWDPPNSRATDAYTKKMAKNVVAGKVPTIHDAGSMGRRQSGKNIKLPRDVMDIINKVQIKKGADIGPVTVEALVQVLHGEKTDPGLILAELTEHFSQSKEEKKRLEVVEKDFNPKSLKEIMLYLTKTRIKLKALRGLYGLHSDEVAAYEKQLALELAEKFIDGMEK